MTKQELIKLVVDDLTVSGSLKLSLNEDEISRIIDVEKNMAYRDWRDAVELKMAVMNPAVFRTKEFKESRTIQLPECVWGIHELREIKDGSRLFGINDPDLSMDRIMASDLYLSPFSWELWLKCSHFFFLSRCSCTAAVAIGLTGCRRWFSTAVNPPADKA